MMVADQFDNAGAKHLRLLGGSLEDEVSTAEHFYFHYNPRNG